MKKFINTTKNKDLEKFFFTQGLDELVSLSKNNLSRGLIRPNLQDLFNLWHLIVLNKRTCVLEFGSGFSSIIISSALTYLKKKNQSQVKKLRRNNPFEHFILENEKKYLNITKKRNFKYKKIINNKINYYFSDVKMSLVNNKIVTLYNKLPICNPDFIYLDGPNQYKVKSNINGINIGHPDMMPMNADLILIEYFLLPGTIILIDGRGANAKFLKDNFKRKWSYFYSKKNDQHLFSLNDTPIGPHNERLIKFYKKNN